MSKHTDPPRPFRPSRPTLVLALLVILLGTAIRIHHFPNVPAGLHQDEASEAYEAYSLLHTGADRWGNRFPTYFLSWGSGQNVMQAYLTVPFVAAAGLTPFTARIVPLLCGILTLPVIFWATGLWFGEAAALAALTILAFCPWAIFNSHVGIENNPLPFFLTLGVLTWTLALRTRSKLGISLCLLPFVAALYTYGIAIPLLCVLLPLLAWLAYPQLRAMPRPQLRAWVAAVALASLLTAPLAFFLFKNHVSKHNYAWERHLPFSAPLLTVTRFDEVQQKNTGDPHWVRTNLGIVYSGLSSDVPIFQVPRHKPLPGIVMLLAALGTVLAAARTLRARRMPDPFLAWLISCVPILLLIPLNTSRAIELGIPLIVMAAAGFAWLLALRNEPLYRGAVVAVGLLLFALPVGLFLVAFNGQAYEREAATLTLPGLPAALADAVAVRYPDELLYISEKIRLNYVQVLFDRGIDPRLFQQSGATVNDPDFGSFRFSRDRILQAGKPFVFLVLARDPDPCADPLAIEQRDGFRIGRCKIAPVSANLLKSTP